MNAIAIIPARMASARFPGKPMAKIHEIPMIGHVFLRTRMSKLLQETYVATCDPVIFDYIGSIGGKAVMTGDHHERCSDRTAEALLQIEKETGKKADLVVMVQGDEPMIMPEMIDQAITPFLKDPSIQVLNLMSKIQSTEEFEDPNTVKVVVDNDSNAIYFSREPIPSRKKGVKDVPMLKQVGMIPFRGDYLLTYNRLQPTPLEKIESVDMMRVIEHGGKVKMVFTEHQSYAVDTPKDLEGVELKMRQDLLMKHYPREVNHV